MSADPRPLVRADEVAGALRACAAVITPIITATLRPNDYPRFEHREDFAKLRAGYHSLSDPIRREVALRFVLEEAERLAHDRGASLSGRVTAS